VTKVEMQPGDPWIGDCPGQIRSHRSARMAK